MKRTFFFIALMSSCIFIAGTGKKTDPPKRKIEPVARWTGTIKREEKATFSNALVVGTSQRYLEVSFSSALPTMNRDDGSTDLNFTDDKGSGSHISYSEGTNLLTKVFCKSDCTGSGTAELHTVIIREWDNTYDIEAIAPACTGKACNEDGSPRPYEEGTETISVSNEKLTDKDVLSGSKTVTGEMPAGFGTITVTTTWVLRRVKEDDVELIVTPEKYDTWLPEPGKNELTKGSMMTVNLKLQGINGKPLKVKAESFELTLNNTSKEPGITINYPIVTDADQLPDLRFLLHPGIESIEEDQFVSVGSADGTTGKALIASYDGGGWTTLNVEAILKDKRRVRGRLLVPAGETDIRIPKRDLNAKIGKAWLKANGDPDELFDEEKSTDNNNDGDGLTAYEEYRGVISENKFKRLNPNKKELGIQLKRSEASLFTEGLQWLENSSDLKVIRFSETEIASNRRLNKNGLSAHDYDQYALRVQKRNLPKGTIGVAYRGPDIPANTDPVVFDWDQIRAAYQEMVDSTKPELLKFTAREYLASTIAHEIAHAIDIWHHGDPSLHPQRLINDISNTNRIFDRHGNPITKRPFFLYGIGKSNSTVESGDLSCFLNYYPYYRWGYTVGADGANIYNETHLFPLGNKLCKSKDGTATNATQLYFGDSKAGKGNCLNQMRLK